MSWPRPIRVVGCGSAHGDDAVAWEAIRCLRDSPAACNAELHTVEGGYNLLDLLDGTGSLILIDAVTTGAPPGTLIRFDWPDRRVNQMRLGSTHQMRPGEALRLAASLQLLPSRVVVLGVESSRFESNSELSREVAVAIPRLVESIVDELRQQIVS